MLVDLYILRLDSFMIIFNSYVHKNISSLKVLGFLNSPTQWKLVRKPYASLEDEPYHTEVDKSTNTIKLSTTDNDFKLRI